MQAVDESIFFIDSRFYFLFLITLLFCTVPGGFWQ